MRLSRRSPPASTPRNALHMHTLAQPAQNPVFPALPPTSCASRSTSGLWRVALNISTFGGGEDQMGRREVNGWLEGWKGGRGCVGRGRGVLL